jgi:hypothetical protein
MFLKKTKTHNEHVIGKINTWFLGSKSQWRVSNPNEGIAHSTNKKNDGFDDACKYCVA